MDLSVGAEGELQSIAAEQSAVLVDKQELATLWPVLPRVADPNSQGRQEEEPLERATLHRVEDASEGPKMLDAKGVCASELNPRATAAVVVFVHQQVPLDAFAGIPVWLQPVRRSFAIQEKR